jgi:hypothetical protein
MPKGFSATALAIIITIVLSFSLVTWIAYSNSSAPKVRGASSSGDLIKPGFSVDVSSQKGTWELYVFLCEEKDTCLESSDSGVRWLTKGGGKTSDSEVFLEATDLWDKYDYIKVFAKPGWGSDERKFSVSKENIPLEVEVKNIDGFDILVLDSRDLRTDFYKVANFSD